MSGDAQTAIPPPVIWAQRPKSILLTICLEDCKKPDIKILNDRIYFKGIGGTEKKEYEVTINLYNEIEPDKSLCSIRDRNIEFKLKKKEEGPFWPHLMKEKMTYHWLKVDFNKWQDEDSSDLDESGPEADTEMDSMMNKIMQGRASGDFKNNFDDIEPDSDDGDLPDLE